MVAVKEAEVAEKEIDELTVGEWKTMQNASKESRGAGSNRFWTGEHRTTKHRLVVTTKQDRSPLAVLEEQGKQDSVLQVLDLMEAINV